MDTRGFIKTTAADKTSPLRLQNVNSNQQCVTPATSILYLQSLTETQANVEWNQFLLHCCCLKRRTSLCSLYISQRLWDTFSVISVFLTVSHVWQAAFMLSIQIYCCWCHTTCETSCRFWFSVQMNDIWCSCPGATASLAAGVFSLSICRAAARFHCCS